MGNLTKRIYENTITPQNKRNNNSVMSLWMGDPLSDIEIMSINSYLYHGHNVIIYVYEDIDNIPKDVDVRDANEILSYDNFKNVDIYRYEKFDNLDIPSKNKMLLCYSFYSDLFRYSLLYKLGGWWTDLDAICMKHYDFDDQYVFAFMEDDNWTVSPGVCKVPAKSSLMKSCVSVCRNFMSKYDFADKTGPYLLSRMVKKHNMGNIIFPHYYFYPFQFYEIHKVFEETNNPFDSYSIHLHHTAIRIKYTKGDVCPEDCLFAKLKKKHL